jgi:multicomponent Na+:H+ antiporter subunit G
VILDLLSWLLLLGGSFFCVVGGIGLLRLPDFYCRTHAGGLTDTLGATLIMGGLMLQAPDLLTAGKLVMIAMLLHVTSPTGTHALVRAAFSRGLRLEGEAEGGDVARP